MQPRRRAVATGTAAPRASYRVTADQGTCNNTRYLRCSSERSTSSQRRDRCCTALVMSIYRSGLHRLVQGLRSRSAMLTKLSHLSSVRRCSSLLRGTASRNLHGMFPSCQAATERLLFVSHRKLNTVKIRIPDPIVSWIGRDHVTAWVHASKKH